MKRKRERRKLWQRIRRKKIKKLRNEGRKRQGRGEAKEG